ncbi:MAG: helix-turn-helix domain-containing protein [Lactobacillus crispatus]|nr:helix-turn-helix domain-containing protein [Lactobacillus crispatus]
MDVVRKDAGKIFEQLVASKGIKKTFIASKMGISPQYLNNIIHFGGFNADFAFKAAKVLDVNPSIFLTKSYRENFKIK